MSPRLNRRALLHLAGLAPLIARAQGALPVVRPGLEIELPRDLGAHPSYRIEWWYVTGALQTPGEPQPYGFQVTFFRARSDVVARDAEAAHSRFAPSQLVFAHAAVTDLRARRLLHEQRIAREGFGIAQATVGDTSLALRDWRMQREGPLGKHVYSTRVDASDAGFAYALQFAATQPVLLQGEAGYSRKGPRPEQASYYLSEPQLDVQGELQLGTRRLPVRGRAWLDHEWSEQLLDPQAVGWDWIGMNLDDGSALTAFRLRRADGSTLWSGGSLRRAGGQARAYADGELRFTPMRRWTSPATRAVYPVQWTIHTPEGAFEVRSLLDDQELDSREAAGSVYWEGLSDLLDTQGRRVGRGYLEMTGYAGALKL